MSREGAKKKKKSLSTKNGFEKSNAGKQKRLPEKKGGFYIQFRIQKNSWVSLNFD